MSGNITFTMIKPKAIADGNMGNIIAKITQGGFHIKALKLTRLTKDQARKFYAVHSERPFFEGLVSFMSSGPIVAAILEKEDAVLNYRNYIGATNPADAAAGSIRALYGTSIEANAVHGSDSDENAVNEGAFFFSEFERF
ncbi:MAG: nucleoside-diphosphate kinase [Bacteroidetes bacterium HGW-Bacteroidetes-16]|jgi:nucleoside-diphosphate kinase|nr:MAG: nucleoside-diphosphate kinase [Bacteroidetes bacterium HGW-Bacteroidetes-16]